MNILGALLFAVTASGQPAHADRPIPQEPGRSEGRVSDMYAWNRRTLVGAYETAGKKDPRWDGLARETLELAARNFGHTPDPWVKDEQVHAAAQRAIDAGCDNALILYLHTRLTRRLNVPDPPDLGKRFVAAAEALSHTTYPPFRRGAAYKHAGLYLANLTDPSPEQRRDAEWMLDASLAVLAESAEKDEVGRDIEMAWYLWPRDVSDGFRKLSGDYGAAFERVDAALAKIPALTVTRLQLRAAYLLSAHWGDPDAMVEARRLLQQAWDDRPGLWPTAMQMINVEKAIGTRWKRGSSGRCGPTPTTRRRARPSSTGSTRSTTTAPWRKW
jgi:hypothetical protein